MFNKSLVNCAITKIFVSLLCILSFTSSASALEPESDSLEYELLFLPFLHVEKRQHVEEGNTNLNEFEIHYGTDVLFSLDYDHFRFLTEFFISPHEAELERLQMAFKINSDNLLWIGRFHSPIGYWNYQFHHGVYLQTSVHRPGVIEYEDDGGVLSNHMTGLKLEGFRSFDESRLHYAFAVGTAPILEDKSLHTWAFSTNRNSHSAQSVMRVGYQPDELNPSQYGIFGSFSRINSEDDDLNYIFQFVSGAYVYQDWNKFRLISAGFYISDRHVAEKFRRSSGFLASYAHVEIDILTDWLVYVRLERTFGNDDDLYLDYLNHPSLDRNLGGIRFDITRRQAISVEMSARISEHETHNHISFQWSAVFP